MILIKNKIKKIKINETQIRKDVTTMLRLLNYQDFDIGILFTTNKTIQKFNKKFRKKDKSTDILSFPYHTNLKAGQKIKINEPEDQNLGDIIISLEFAQKDVNQLNTTLKKHIKTLLAHGISHLLGYTHQKDFDYNLMHKFEQKLLKLK
ncbi:rRNA maturation RNase YbeY [Candidatus Dependentiae bacterium]